MRISRDLLILGLLILLCNGVFGQGIVGDPAVAGTGPVAGAGAAVAAPGLLGLVPVILIGIVGIFLVSALTRSGDTEDDGIDVDGSDIDSDPDDCPEGYFLRQSTDRCYFLSATKRSFNNAREACMDGGGDLANFQSGVDELEFIRDAIGNESDDDWYVLARKVDGNFVFGTDGNAAEIPAAFFNDDAIPNRIFRNCAAMTFDDDQDNVDANDGRLKDTFCSSSNRFVCEVGPSS